MRKLTCFCHMRTTKAQISLCSLISAFVVHCLDSIIPILAKSKISRSYLVPNLEDRFLVTGIICNLQMLQLKDMIIGSVIF